MATPPVLTVGLTSAGTGVSLTSDWGNAGTAQAPILVTKSLLAGPGITIKAGDSGVDVILSATGNPSLGSVVTGHVHWTAGGAAPRLPIFTAAYPVSVTAIIGRVETASTTFGTLMLVKVANGVPIASGVALSTAAFNVSGTLYANQILPLVADFTVLSLDAGDSIGVVIAGTWTNASGGVTVHLAPTPAF